MASPSETATRPPSVTHQIGQGLIAAEVARSVAESAWPLLDLRNISDSLPKLVAVIMAIIQRYGTASAVHAGDYYRTARLAASVPGRFTVTPAPLPPTEQVSNSLGWATHTLYGTPTPEAEQAALTNVEGIVQTLALDMGRDTILDAVAHDDKAKGWARVPESGACYFCLLLATRGAVYKSKGSFDKSNKKFTGAGEFKVHNHCACHLEPQFSDRYEPTAEVRSALALYKATPYGANAAEARNNFRVALQAERDAGR